MSKKDSFTTIVVKNSESEISAADEKLIRALGAKLEKLKPYFTVGGGMTGFIGGFATAVVAAHLKGLSLDSSVGIISAIITLFGAGVGALVARDVTQKASDKSNQEFRNQVEEKTKYVLEANLTGAAVGRKFWEIKKQYQQLGLDSDPLLASSASSTAGFFTSSESSLLTSSFADLNIEYKKSNNFTRKVFADLESKNIELSAQDKGRINLLGMKWNKFNKRTVMSSSDIHSFAVAVHHAYATGLEPKIMSSIYAAIKAITSRETSQAIASVVKDRALKMSRDLESTTEEINENEEGILDPKLEQLRAKGKSRRDKDEYDPSVFGRSSKTKSNSDSSPSSTSSSSSSSTFGW